MTGKPNMILAVMLAFLFTPGYVFSQDIEIRSEVSELSIPVNGQLTLTVFITGADAGSAGEPFLDSLPDFTILRTSSSRSLEIVNLKTSVHLTYQYVLVANAVGEFEVGAVSVTAGGKSFTAPGTTVRVVGSRRPGGAQPSTPGAQSPSSPQSAEEAIFVSASVDKKEVYIGEQMTYSFELYNRLNTTNFEYEPPVTTGFWTVELPDVPASTRVFNNRQYNYNVLRMALFPTVSGPLTIGSASISFRTGIGFFATGPMRELATDPITITVKPLPAQRKPSDFNGAVGIFQIAASVERDSVNVGDAVPITVTVNGGGNLDLISSIHEPDFSAYRTYAPRVISSVRNSGINVGGTKTWEYVIIPRQQGRATVNPFALSYFNPADNKYYTVTTKPIELAVLLAPQSVAENGNQNNGAIARDIRYLKPNKNELNSASRNLFTFWLFPFLYFIPVAVFAATLRYKKRLNEIERNTGLKRKLNAWKHARKRLGEAALLLSEKDEKGFCGKLQESLVTYIGDMVDIDTGTHTAGSLEKMLLERGVHEELAQNSRKLMEICDFIRFASINSNPEMLESMYRDISTCLDQLKEVL